MNIIEKDLQFNSLTDLQSVKYFVLHHTGVDVDQSVEQIHDFHKNTRGWAGIGYHFLICKDGSIYRGRPEDKQGAHAREVNSESLGISLTGDFNSKKPTEKQINSLAKLIIYLFDRYGELPPTTHEDHGDTSCPGDNFPWDDLHERLDNNMPEKVKVNMFGEEIDGIMHGGQTYIHVRELEKIRFNVDWEDGKTEVTVERSD